MRFIMTAIVGLSLATVPVLSGCDRTVSNHEESHQNPDGTVTHQQDKTVVDQNGNTVHEKTKSTDKP